MPTISQRAERLIVIRDLVVSGLEEGIRKHSVLRQMALAEGILVRVSDGRPLDRASVYRYLDALRFLGFDASVEGADSIIWTRAARTLAEHGSGTCGTEMLSEAEQGVFRESIFRSRVAEQFLSCFLPPGVQTCSSTEFVRLAQPLYVLNACVTRPPDKRRSDEWPAQENVEITVDPDSGNIMRKPRKEFLYTYRYWCLDAGIIDELNVREAERYDIPKSRSYVLFALDPAKSVSLDAFLSALYASLGNSRRRAQVVPVPWLMYRVCPQTRIAVETFKSLLLQVCQRYRSLMYLERGPGALVQGELLPSRQQYSTRYGNHRYYPVLDGTIRSHLVVFPKRQGG